MLNPVGYQSRIVGIAIYGKGWRPEVAILRKNGYGTGIQVDYHDVTSASMARLKSVQETLHKAGRWGKSTSGRVYGELWKK